MKRLRFIDFITINLFWFGMNIRNTAVGSVFTPYLVALYAPAAWKNTALSALSTAGLIIAMLIQPMAGLISDRSTSRFGRRRPFILIGTLLDLVFLAFIGLSWNYWSLLVAVLLIQFSANLSHGPLQGLIPDLVPEDQRGRASAVKALLELVPIMLVGAIIATMVGAGQLGKAIFVTGGVLLLTALVTVLTVKEQSLVDKPTDSLWQPMLKVVGMLLGIIFGAIAGLLAGELIGGVGGLITWLIAGKETALVVTIAIGGVVAMIVAVVVGVWVGSISTLSKGSSILIGALAGLVGGSILGGAAYLIALPLYARNIAIIAGFTLGGIIALVIAIYLGTRGDAVVTFKQDARTNSSFIWWIVNRLFFLAAITSLQRFALYFLMYSFNIEVAAATTLFGRLITIIGIFIFLSALLGGWLADRFDHKLLVGLSGILAAAGGVLLLGTIWVPTEALIYVAGSILGMGTGVFMTTNWAMGTNLVPPAEAGRYLGISNLAGAGAGMIGGSIGGPIADYLNISQPGLGYFVIFAGYAVLFILSTVSLRYIRTPKRTAPANPG